MDDSNQPITPVNPSPANLNPLDPNPTAPILSSEPAQSLTPPINPPPVIPNPQVINPAPPPTPTPQPLQQTQVNIANAVKEEPLRTELSPPETPKVDLNMDQPAPEVPQVPSSMQTETELPEQEGGNKKKFLIVGAIVLIIILIIGVFFAWNTFGQTSKTDSPASNITSETPNISTPPAPPKKSTERFITPESTSPAIGR